ncbi:MAG: hypothetical protein QM755_09240 [Luteolibacter sp.]
MSAPTCNCCGLPLPDTIAHTFDVPFGKVCRPCGSELRIADDVLKRAGMTNVYLGPCGDNDPPQPATA